VIRAVVKTAVGEFGMKCIGIEDSFDGILGELIPSNSNLKAVSGICRAAGRFSARATAEASARSSTASDFPEMPIEEALDNLDKLEIEAMIVIGGEGTLAIADQFRKRGFSRYRRPQNHRTTIFRRPN
jgi:6-phosphofructokinase 1